MDSKIAFEKFKMPNTFNLADSNHLLEFYIGIDDRNRKSIILRSQNKPDKVTETSAINVTIGQTMEGIWSIGFHLKNDGMAGLFYKFCDDLIESSRELLTDELGMSFVVKRYNQWKKMFYKTKNNLLQEHEIMGLIGELLFLKQDMLKKLSEDMAIASWSGCDKTHKDFSVENTWYEIKTTHSSSLTIKISSIDQLDGDDSGVLVSYELEKMSNVFDGINLNGLISEILSSINIENQDILLEKLKVAGYFYDDAYDEYNYICKSKNYYSVKKDFPRIKSLDLKNSIVKVQYEILKKDLDCFKI